MYDLSKLDTSKKANAGIDFQVLDFDGKPTGIVIKIVGVDSDIYNTFQREQLDKMLADRASEGTKAPDPLDAEVSMLAACTLGWSGLVLDGQELPFSDENAKMLYRRFAWLRNRIDRAIGNRSLFLPE